MEQGEREAERTVEGGREGVGVRETSVTATISLVTARRTDFKHTIFESVRVVAVPMAVITSISSPQREKISRTSHMIGLASRSLCVSGVCA